MLKLILCGVLAPFFMFAELASPNSAGIAYGHFHFNGSDLAAHKKFWTALGATPAKALGNNDVYRVTNALVMVKKAETAGGTETTVVNHIGFKVKDLDGTLGAVRAAGFRIITPAETTAKSHKANVMGPDEINVELVADASLDVPIASHHVHFYNNPIEDTRAWYVKTFAAVPGKRDIFEAADVPGINLSFSAAKGTPAGTKGRALDHIGFEVKNLEAFCRKLEASGVKFDRPYTKLPQIGLSVAFLTDPWGTYIELTEGLDRL
jgi:catechol 2,3-dioxygenase-like lactoylglutathione lyase family enzyme